MAGVPRSAMVRNERGQMAPLKYAPQPPMSKGWRGADGPRYTPTGLLTPLVGPEPVMPIGAASAAGMGKTANIAIRKAMPIIRSSIRVIRGSPVSDTGKRTAVTPKMSGPKETKEE